MENKELIEKIDERIVQLCTSPSGGPEINVSIAGLITARANMTSIYNSIGVSELLTTIDEKINSILTFQGTGPESTMALAELITARATLSNSKFKI